MASLGELFIELGVKGDASKLEEFDKKIKSIVYGSDKAAENQEKLDKAFKKAALELGLFVGAISGAVFALNKLAESLINSNKVMLDLTRQSNIALSTFQKWDSVGKMFGINNAAQQLENLNEKIFDLKLTGEGARGFQLAGVMPTNAEDVMEQLRNRIQGMDNTAATYLLKQMGIDPQMITLLRLSRQEYEQLVSEIKQYQLTDEQRQSLMMMNVQLQIANQKWQYFREQVLMAILPDFITFTQYMGKLAGGLAKVVKWIGQSNSGWASFIRVLLKTLGLLIGITTLIKGIPLIIKVITLGVQQLASVLTLIMAHPVVATLTAIIGALALIADDIYGYYSGKKSLFGVILKAMEDFKTTGIFGDDVPKWIQLLAVAADKLYSVYCERKNNEQIRNNALAETKNIIDSGKNLSSQEALKLIKGMSTPNNVPFMIKSLDNLMPFNWLKGITSKKETNITQNNYIETTQPAYNIYEDLLFSNSMFRG